MSFYLCMIFAPLYLLCNSNGLGSWCGNQLMLNLTCLGRCLSGLVLCERWICCLWIRILVGSCYCEETWASCPWTYHSPWTFSKFSKVLLLGVVKKDCLNAALNSMKRVLSISLSRRAMALMKAIRPPSGMLSFMACAKKYL